MTDMVLEVGNLVVRSAAGTPLIDGVSFDLARRTRTGLIGESGSGKTLTALSIMGLLPEGLTAEDVARAVIYALEQPDTVNINEVLLTPNS